MSSPARSARGDRPRACTRLALALPAVLIASTVALLPTGAAISATDPSTTPTTPTPTAAPSVTPAPNPTPPKVTTGTAEAIGGSGATLTGTLSANGGATSYQFEYGTTTSYGLVTTAASVAADASNATVKVPITGLTAGTTYHARLVATNAAGTVRGSDRSFTTSSSGKAPGISTQAATKSTSTSGQLNARVSPNGQATTVRFDWGVTKAYGNTTASTSAGSSKGTVSRGIGIGSLAAGTTYHYRAVAQNAAGVVYGKDRTFTTTRGLTKLTGSASSGVMPWNGSLKVSGQLSGAKPGGVKLELLRQDFPFNGLWRRIATISTNGTGGYGTTLRRVYSSVNIRVRVIGSSTLVSPVVRIQSQLLVKIQQGVRKARTSRVRGTIYPVQRGATAVLQRQTPSGRWVRVRNLRLSVRPGNRLSYRTVVRRIGRDAAYRVVADPRDGGEHIATVSGTVTVKARKK